MRVRFQRPIGVLAAAALAVAGLVFATPGSAEEKKSKSVQSEVEWIAFDAAAETVKVKVKKPGSGAKGLSANQEAVVKVKHEGSVLSKTTVKVNGRKGELKDIPVGKTVLLYWVDQDGGRFARAIDVIFSDEELDARYGIEDEE